MKFNAHKFGFAGSIASGLCYTICTLFCYFLPDLSFSLMAPMIHLTSLQLFIPYHQISMKIYLMGLSQWVIYSYMLLGFFAWFYNKIIGSNE